MSDLVERFAFEFVGRVLGVRVEPYDIAGRQRAVDALLHYPDGHVAALEVSSIGPEPEARITNVLAAGAQTRRPAGLKHTWMVQVPRDLHPAELRKVDEVVLECERRGLATLDELVEHDAAAEVLHDLGVSAFIAPRPAGAPPTIWAVPAIIGGFTGTGITTLPGELEAALAAAKMRSKTAKLLASGCDERHLFLLVRPQAFSFSVFNELAVEATLPAEPPNLPNGLDQIWLTTEFQQGGIVRGAKTGWSRIALHHA